MKTPELLSPVADFTSLVAAIEAGADAVYFGLKELNMRMAAKNFSLNELKKVVDKCHKNNVKSYLALNTIIYDNETNKLKAILKKAKEAKVDAVICWDFSVINEADKLNIPVHISTQASISNFESLLFLKNKIKNLKRAVLARELSLDQIKKIVYNIKKNKLNIEIETFIHGAMCVSISGRCFFSHEVFGKSANRGECLQPCRRKYSIKDIEENHEFELGENYIISPKDLCALPFIEKLIDAGISSFKIEGRNRSPEYVKTTTECYREIIDYCSNNKNSMNNKKTINEYKLLKKKLLKKLKTVYNRDFSSGFYLGKPVNEWVDAYGSKATKKKIYLGYIKNFYNEVSVAEVILETDNIKLNDRIMIQGPTTGVFEQNASSMETNHKKVTSAKKGKRVGIKIIRKARINDKVYLIR